jgi:hypothetical protein
MTKIFTTSLFVLATITAIGSAHADDFEIVKQPKLPCIGSILKCQTGINLGQGRIDADKLANTSPIYRPPVDPSVSSSTLPVPAPDLPVVDIEYDSPEGISCGEGRQIARKRGFRHVRAMDCSGEEFLYHATKRGKGYEVTINSLGRIVDLATDIGD